MYEIYFLYILTAPEIYGCHGRNYCDKTRVQFPVQLNHRLWLAVYND